MFGKNKPRKDLFYADKAYLAGVEATLAEKVVAESSTPISPPPPPKPEPTQQVPRLKNPRSLGSLAGWLIALFETGLIVGLFLRFLLA